MGMVRVNGEGQERGEGGMELIIIGKSWGRERWCHVRRPALRREGEEGGGGRPPEVQVIGSPLRIHQVWPARPVCSPGHQPKPAKCSASMPISQARLHAATPCQSRLPAVTPCPAASLPASFLHFLHWPAIGSLPGHAHFSQIGADNSDVSLSGQAWPWAYPSEEPLVCAGNGHKNAGVGEAKAKVSRLEAR